MFKESASETSSIESAYAHSGACTHKTTKLRVQSPVLAPTIPHTQRKRPNDGSILVARTIKKVCTKKFGKKSRVFADQDVEVGLYVFFTASLIFEARVMASALWACIA